MNNFKILVACEESQKVTTSFIKMGFNATSCDIQKTRGSYPHKHIVGCALKEAYSGKYDMLIAFPPCTYLANVGAPHLMKGGSLQLERYYKGKDARDFFMALLNAPIKYKCIENPTPLKCFGLPLHTQVIQPYEHGHPYTKRTLLWLRNLPTIAPSHYVEPRKSWMNAKRNPKYRSETFQGIADAMASTFGRYILNNHTQRV
jgi:hypothetical protein